MRPVIHRRREFKIALKGGLIYCSTLQVFDAEGEKFEELYYCDIVPKRWPLGEKLSNTNFLSYFFFSHSLSLTQTHTYTQNKNKHTYE